MTVFRNHETGGGFILTAFTHYQKYDNEIIGNWLKLVKLCGPQLYMNIIKTIIKYYCLNVQFLKPMDF